MAPENAFFGGIYYWGLPEGILKAEVAFQGIRAPKGQGYRTTKHLSSEGGCNALIRVPDTASTAAYPVSHLSFLRYRAAGPKRGNAHKRTALKCVGVSAQDWGSGRKAPSS